MGTSNLIQKTKGVLPAPRRLHGHEAPGETVDLRGLVVVVRVRAVQRSLTKGTPPVDIAGVSSQSTRCPPFSLPNCCGLSGTALLHINGLGLKAR